MCIRDRALADQLRGGLAGIPGVTVHDLGRFPAAIVSFSVHGIASDAVKARLAEAAINVSTSTPSSTLLDATVRGLPIVVRASPHYYNSEDEIGRLTTAIQGMARAA